MRKAFIITFPIVLIILGFYFFFITYIAAQNLYFQTILLKQAGHLVVPNSIVLSSLLNLKNIILGSLFITSTAGIIIAFTIAFIISLFFITRESVYTISSVFLPIVISITLVGTSLYVYDKDDLFPRIRDSLLLSTSLGQTLNTFYYKYTLTASETVQNKMQKQIKPCWVDPGIKNQESIKKVLFRFGFLPVNKQLYDSLIIQNNFKSQLEFIQNNQPLFRVSPERFLLNPEKYLNQYSDMVDSKKILRTLCSFGIYPGYPVLLFIFIYLLFMLFFFIIRIKKNSNLLASTMTAVLIIGLLFYLNPEILKEPDAAKIKSMLYSAESRDRITALRIIHKKKLEIENFSLIASQLIKGNSVEKYWLAKNLALLKNMQSRSLLTDLIKDDSMNVRYCAMESLSEIDPGINSLRLFKQIINNSNAKNNLNADKWYVQFYAYNAYKKCVLLQD